MAPPKSGGGGGPARRTLLDLGGLRGGALRAAEVEETSEHGESVFIPNASSAAPAPAIARPPPATVAAPVGLAGLVSYSDSEDDDEAAAPWPSTATTVAATSAAAASATAVDALPAGWTSCVDEVSGDEYWWNQQTDVTTWERPVAEAAIAAPSDPPDQPATTPNPGGDHADADALLPGWTQVADPTSNDTYYWHEATDETTWDRPSALRAASKENVATPPAPAAQAPEPSPIATPTPVAVLVVLTSSANSLFIAALLAGVNARLREPLDALVTPAPSSVRDSISPLMRIAVQFEWLESQWMAAQQVNQAEVDAHAPRILEQLQQITQELDGALAMERTWRATRPQPQLQPIAAPTPPPQLATASRPSPSGFVHPSRAPVVGMLVGATTAPPPRKRERSPDAGATGAPKKLKVAGKKPPAAPSMPKGLVALTSKWQAVSASATEDEEERKPNKWHDEWKTSRGNANLVPVGDEWRAKLAQQSPPG